MAIKLILFDLDGTLVNTSKDITNALNYALNPYRTQALTVKDTTKMVGEGITRLVEKVLGSEKIHKRDEVIERFLNYYSEHLVDYSREYPHARETLENLYRYKKAVISNKRESLSTRVLDELDLLKYFDIVVGSDTTSEKKPSPMPILYVMNKVNVNSHESMIVGDNEYDIEAGKKAGIKTVAVTYGYREKQYLQDADYTIDSLQDLVGLIYIRR